MITSTALFFLVVFILFGLLIFKMLMSKQKNKIGLLLYFVIVIIVIVGILIFLYNKDSFDPNAPRIAYSQDVKQIYE